MSCFKLPISLCDKIQSLLTRFWWDDKPGIKKICWVSWDKLTLPPSAGGLGFREIKEFNESLLAKISWRLLEDPNSLLARIYKGKYFPFSTFMESSISSNASHGWSGIIAGRKVLMQEMGWTVGNGRNINVWTDAWLSYSQPMQPYGPPPLHSLNLKVADLIHQESKRWNLEAIRNHLPHYEDLITRIVLSSFAMEDTITWLPDKSGVYSTKSGYAITNLNVNPQVVEIFDWKACVWKIKTAPKIKNFLWKVKSKALAVGSNLITRGVTNNIQCKYCGELEDEMHIIRLCPFAVKVWELTPIMFKADQVVPLSLNQFLDTARKHVNLPPTGLTEYPLYPWLLWNLWKARNQLVFENRRISEENVVLKAIKEARSWQTAQVVITRQKPAQALLKPTSLVQQATHCFMDASWVAETMECGMGWCFKDENMRTITTDSTSRTKVTSALIGEALAMKAALIAAKSKGFRVLNCFSDSLSLITLLNSNGVINELRPILFDIRCLRSDFTSISFAFIPRSDNVLADSLAKFGLVTLNSSS